MFAYLTATDTATNKFTLSHKLDIEVLEANWVEDDAKNVLPTQTITKDPLIHNKTDIPAYVFADVQIPTATIVTANEEGTPSEAKLTELFTYSLTENSNWQLIDVIDDANTRTFRYAYKEIVAGDGNTGNIFTSVTACNYVDNQISESMKTQNIIITGYAIQASSFEDEGTTPAWAKAWLAYAGEDDSINAVNNLMLETTSEYTGTETVMFRSYAPVDSLVSVTMDGVVVDEENYVATSGSTVITFESDYMNGLEDGEHIVGINNGVEYGGVSANFMVAATHNGGAEPSTPTKTPAELAAEYASAYAAAKIVNDSYAGKLGDEVLWWVEDGENTVSIPEVKGSYPYKLSGNYNQVDEKILYIAPEDGETGHVVNSWYENGSSPFGYQNACNITTIVIKSTIIMDSKADFLFSSCEKLVNIEGLSNINMSQTTSMSGMFASCYSLSNIDLSSWNTESLENINNLFTNCLSLANINSLSAWNTSKITNMSNAFCNCQSLTNISAIGTWNTASLNNITSMFAKCKSITSLNALSNLNTNNITSLSCIFDGCSNLTDITALSSWNTSSISSLYASFRDCTSLSSIKSIENWNTQSLTNIDYAFSGCTSLTNLTDINNWSANSITSKKNTFQSIPSSIPRPSWY